MSRGLSVLVLAVVAVRRASNSVACGARAASTPRDEATYGAFGMFGVGSGASHAPGGSFVIQTIYPGCKQRQFPCS